MIKILYSIEKRRESRKSFMIQNHIFTWRWQPRHFLQLFHDKCSKYTNWSVSRQQTRALDRGRTSEPANGSNGEWTKGAARHGRVREARYDHAAGQRLKRNEILKKTPRSYIDVTVTWRRITGSHRPACHATHNFKTNCFKTQDWSSQ